MQLMDFSFSLFRIKNYHKIISFIKNRATNIYLAMLVTVLGTRFRVVNKRAKSPVSWRLQSCGIEGGGRESKQVNV